MVDFVRKRNRLPPSAYVGRGWYFVMLCTGGRRNLFADPLVALLVTILREKSSIRGFGIYAYCFMPDHMHLELASLSPEPDLTALVRDFKGAATAMARQEGWRNLWQKGFYDHILRQQDREKAVAWYIFNNPVRKGLVEDLRDWPYSGSFMFDWKKLLAPPDEFVPPWKSRGGFTPPSAVAR